MCYPALIARVRFICLVTAIPIWATHGVTQHALASAQTKESEVTQGKYLTNILGCGGCHTEGALLGEQSGPWLAGSKIGIAYAEDHTGEPTAVVFPSNLTSDQATGLGAWSKREIMELLTNGRSHSGEIVNRVMPWSNYRFLKPADVSAIAAFLKSMPAVSNKIPEQILPGEVINDAYVRFGVYLFLPENAPRSTGEANPPKCREDSC